ncbi:MAG TPA: (2Fe-2S)-binding protein [Burkholderiales bacterium]|nr:(2Fe-2S)-binding protein [Burkholderiales bacterium]
MHVSPADGKAPVNDLSRSQTLDLPDKVPVLHSRDGADRKAPVTTSHRVQFRVNGRQVSAELEARVTLLDYLRDRLHLTGTKKGCNEGACGTCTVLVDGKRMNSCLTLAVQCAGRDITTIEGVALSGELHPVQEAFMSHDAFQCGYCTPGQVVSAIACIAEGHATDADSVREWMSGNICRCSAYPQITAAVLDAARKMES